MNINKFNENKQNINKLLHKLNEALKLHILKQKEAGADVLQIFDSWAGLIPNEDIEEYCYKPNKKLVEFCKEIKIPSICFPKGIGENYKNFVKYVRPNCISIDFNIDPEWAKENLENVCVQGGLDPSLLIGDEKKMLQEVDRYLNIFKNNSYIFNLGHGILPQTNPETVRKIVNKIKNFNK